MDWKGKVKRRSQMKNFEDTNSIAVMTTIAPFNIDNQRKAINSWLDAGFKVMSYNCPEEIEKLIPHFGDVEFVEAKRDARKEYGKPYVYFIDIIEFFKKSTYKVCGIINSDIHLKGVNQNIIDFIMDEAKSSLVFGQRVDIDTFDDLSGSMYIGFDYFFFDRKITGIYPEEKFCIGQPVWDYWIIFVAAINNIKAKKMINHIAYHITHGQNWSEETNNSLTDVILGKYMGFLGKETTSHEELYREYKRYVFHKNEDIYCNTSDKESSILVVYNDRGVKDIDRSNTYRSILSQKYSNYRIVRGTLETLDIKSIKEDMVYYISEGYIARSNFLRIMSESMKDKELAVCGIKVVYPETMSVDFIYPYSKKGSNDGVELLHSCFLYKSDYLKGRGIPEDIDTGKTSFVGQGMVELISNYIQLLYYERKYEDIIETYSDCNLSEIQYYVAMSYKQLGNFIKANASFSIMIENEENHIANPSFVYMQYSFDDIADIVLKNDSDMNSDIWKKLYNFCIRRMDIRYKILKALYEKKMYERILEFEPIEAEEVFFYLGRAYKDMGCNDLADHYLNKFLQSLKAGEDYRVKSVLGSNYLLSAYYHLGEIYYLKQDIEKAREYFELCISLSDTPHKKAQEYLLKL